MTPLGYILLKALNYGVGFSALCLGILLAALMWDRWFAPTPMGLASGVGMIVFIAVCFLAALWLFRSISRELKAVGPPR